MRMAFITRSFPVWISRADYGAGAQGASQIAHRGPRLCGNHAELPQLCVDVDDSPDLGDLAVGEAEDEDLVVGDGLAGRRDAPVLALVSTGDRVPDDDLVVFRDQVFVRDVQVGERAKEHRPHLPERL